MNTLLWPDKPKVLQNVLLDGTTALAALRRNLDYIRHYTL